MVYVDDGRWPYRNMLMSHCVADTEAELRALAERIGVDPKHIENTGTPRVHLDVCQAKRNRAIGAGAIPITRRQCAAMRACREAGGELGDPSTAIARWAELRNKL